MLSNSWLCEIRYTPKKVTSKFNNTIIIDRPKKYRANLVPRSITLDLDLNIFIQPVRCKSDFTHFQSKIIPREFQIILTYIFPRYYTG